MDNAEHNSGEALDHGEHAVDGAGAKPRALQGDLRMLPAALRPLIKERRWVVWKWERSPKRDKWTKVPYQGRHPDLKASTNKPQTWCDHIEAVKAVETGLADGIGFMLHDSDIAAFALDDCRDPETGQIAPWARALIDEAQSYTEITVSGTGLRIIGRASGPPVHRKQKVPTTGGSLETYRRATRYIVITGGHLTDTYDDLSDIDAIIDRAVKRVGEQTQAEVNRFRLPDLPIELAQLIQHGVPVGQRSEKFFHVVGWLKDRGFSVDQVEHLLREHPDGIAQKYKGRLRQQVEECFAKAGGQNRREKPTPGEAQPQQRIPLRWHGEAAPDEDRAWLIRDLIPEAGKGLLSGQWGSGKTFGALDLSASVMTMEPFAGRKVARQGGVLFIAPEGAYEIPIRLRGLIEGKLLGLPFLQFARGAKAIDPNKLPIAWIDQCPPLVSDDAITVLAATAQEAAERMQREFGLPLVLIVVDTVAASSGVTDENAAAENHRVMNALESLSRQTGAFVLGVDHFGKAIETGTRGSSAKEAAADVVLAMLADRDVSGTVSNTRMAVRKLRGGATGAETPYLLEQVKLGENRDGEPITTCFVHWQLDRATTAATAEARQRWPRSLRVFHTAMQVALIDHGGPKYPYGVEGAQLQVVAIEKVRTEFINAYPADGDNSGKRSDAKAKAFKRSLNTARECELVVSRELGGIDYLWFKDSEDERRPSAS